jgi:hypothetical protein
MIIHGSLYSQSSTIKFGVTNTEYETLFNRVYNLVTSLNKRKTLTIDTPNGKFKYFTVFNQPTGIKQVGRQYRYASQEKTVDTAISLNGHGWDYMQPYEEMGLNRNQAYHYLKQMEAHLNGQLN